MSTLSTDVKLAIKAETLRRFFTAKSSQALRYPQPVEVKPMEASIPTTPSSRGVPLPHHEALKCPLFFDPRGPPAHSNYNARLAMEKKALAFARAGFSRIEHISSDQRTPLSTAIFCFCPGRALPPWICWPCG